MWVLVTVLSPETPVGAGDNTVTNTPVTGKWLLLLPSVGANVELGRSSQGAFHRGDHCNPGPAVKPS